MKLVVEAAGDPDLLRLAALIGAPRIGTSGATERPADPAAWVLRRDNKGLVVCAPVAGGRAEVRVQTRARAGLSRTTSLLARAIGGRRGARVIDATAGLGRDTFELAALGYHVLACERHPVLVLAGQGWHQGVAR